MRILTALLFLVLTAAGAGAAQVYISINKATQKMTVSVDGATKYVWPVSTGASGYTTPSGNFRPFRMVVDHYSREWDDAPMPHSIFFTTRGHAIHGSYHVKRLGRPVSHGCVRLAPSNAATLYGLVRRAGMKNTTIVVKKGFGFGIDNPISGIKSSVRKVRIKKPKPPKWLDDIFG